MMRGGRAGAGRGDWPRLFDGGSAAGLGEGDLVGRFVDRRDGEAFAILVGRLGPMVWGVCRRMLRDEGDAEDAFQATFLVLARRAASIRDRDLVATWLYRVAVHVSRKARANAARRPALDRLGAVAEAREDEPRLERAEVRAGIDEEIGRLPESHRRVVILCDVEGLDRGEAAARLGWTANMVRGRLERARARLRDRLARRGLAPSGTPFALAHPAPPARLVLALTRPDWSLAAGPSAASASAVALSEGVLRMMMLAKWKFAAPALLAAGTIMAAGPGRLMARPGPDEVPPAPAPATAAPAPSPVAPDGTFLRSYYAKLFSVPVTNRFVPRPAAELAWARLQEANRLLNILWAFHGEGRLVIGRLIDASRALRDTEFDVGPKSVRVVAARSHHARLGDILRQEEAGRVAGRANQADISEVKSALLEAEFVLAREIEASNHEGRGGPPSQETGSTSASRRPRSLAAAIADYNQGMAGKGESPLTEAEVIAAIKDWKPTPQDQGQAIAVPPGTPIDAFKAIARTREMPLGSWFGTLSEGGAVSEDIERGIRISLAIPMEDGQVFEFLIRFRVIPRPNLRSAALDPQSGAARRLTDPVTVRRPRAIPVRAAEELGIRSTRAVPWPVNNPVAP